MHAARLLEHSTRTPRLGSTVHTRQETAAPAPTPKQADAVVVGNDKRCRPARHACAGSHPARLLSRSPPDGNDESVAVGVLGVGRRASGGGAPARDAWATRTHARSGGHSQGVGAQWFGTGHTTHRPSAWPTGEGAVVGWPACVTGRSLRPASLRQL